MSAPAPAPKRSLWLAVSASALLAIAGGVAFYYASVRNAEVTRGQVADATVSVLAGSCSPNELTVPGGRRSFEIINESDRPVEWEILDGVMVVAERENIAPGFRQTLTVQLSPGDYDITCGLLTNPRGTLHVTASDEAAAAASEVTIRKFLGPLAEYRVYAVLQAGKAVSTAKALRDAIATGDVEAAKSAWTAARVPYRHIEPLAARISDLENRIDPLPTYLDQREQDPGFTGYHRIEYGLFEQGSTDGLGPVADALVTDLETLQERLKALQLEPNLLTAMPADMARLLADTQVVAGENGYAKTDLAEFVASAEGLTKLTSLLGTIVKDVNPTLNDQINADVAAIGTALAGYKSGEAFPSYDTVTTDQRQALAGHFSKLAQDLDQLTTVIGMQ